VLLQLAAGEAEHDAGVLDMTHLTARLAYAMMCLTLTWGVFTSMGWVNRLTGRQALRSSHMVFATLTIGFASVHGLSFLLLKNGGFSVIQLVIPFQTGLKNALGTLALEGLVAASVGIGLRKWMTYYRWLWLHRLAYPAFALGVLHALLEAVADGSMSAVWIGGITLLIPPVTAAALRMLPTRALATTGLIEDAP
jgi:methionine sulfoxide reductase heme-binding subunit